MPQLSGQSATFETAAREGVPPAATNAGLAPAPTSSFTSALCGKCLWTGAYVCTTVFPLIHVQPALEPLL